MEKEPKIYTLYISKGGAIKTTTVMAMAYGINIVKPNSKILIVDCDFQKNTTSTILGNIQDDMRSTYGVITNKIDINEAIYKTSNPAIDILAGSVMLANVDIELQNKLGKEYRLKEAFKNLKIDYDYIIIDTSVLMSTMVVNALTASTDLIIPARPDQFTLDGLQLLSSSISDIRSYTNPDLNIAGILIGYMNDTVLAKDMVKRFEEEADKLNTKVFSSKVRTNVTVPEAQAMHQSLFEYAPKSKATQGYLDFVKELLGE